jgi:hypothetical protein
MTSPTQERRPAEPPVPSLGSASMDRVRISRLVRSVFRPQTTNLLPPATVRDLALRFRAYCREAGPHEILAAIGAPSEVDGADLRTVAYLFAHTVAREDAIELCVEQGIYGFQEWLEARK